MEKRILIDLNDKANWLYESTSPPTPEGHIMEENRVILMPEGEHKLFAFTDAVMHHVPGMTGNEHVHHKGYETFFVDSGSLDFYSMGKVCTLKKGDLYHLPPYVTHGMVFHEDTRYRGIFQDWAILDNFHETFELRRRLPEVADRMNRPPEGEAPPVMDFSAMDMHIREKYNCERVEPEAIPAVRNPARPLNRFDFDGVVMKQMVGRWECNGVREIWRAEMTKGFYAEWDETPDYPELFYVTEGRIKFKVYDEEFIAYEDCLVRIPKYAPRYLEAETDAAMYDILGLPSWYEFLHDYTGMMQNNPDRAKDEAVMRRLKTATKCAIKSIGMK